MENRRPTPQEIANAPKEMMDYLRKNGWEEQLMASLLMVQGKDYLPAEMVQPHIDLLQYWGLLGQVISGNGENTVDK